MYSAKIKAIIKTILTTRANLTFFDLKSPDRNAEIFLDRNLDSLNLKQTLDFYYFSEFRLDVGKRRLWHDEELVSLTPKEIEVLLFLVERAGKVVEKNDLLDAIWADTFVEESTLARNVSWLRKKLGKITKDEKLIETVSKRGYRFIAEVTRPSKNENALIVEEQTVQHFHIEETVSFADERSEKVLRQPIALPDSKPKTKIRNSKLIWLVFGAITLPLFGFFIYQNYIQYGKSEVKAVVAKKVVAFTGESGDEDDPKFSPDGKRIVYSMKPVDGENRNIHVRQINVGDSVKLTDSNVNDRYPTFSPDGSHVGFLREYKDYGELITVPSLGGGERVIRRLFTGNYSISYSPASEDIAVIDTEDSEVGGQYAVYLVNTQTFERRRLTAQGDFEGETTPRFSPDGKKVAFVRLWDHKQDLFVVPASGGEPRRLTFDNETINSLSWSPNGEEIYFVSYRKGKKARMWRISLAGGEPELVSIGSENLVNMAISPNGKTLAFSVRGEKISIYRIKPDGQAAQKFIASNGSDRASEYSPDGSRILFRSNRKRDASILEKIDVWTADAEGNDLRRITNSMDTIAVPVYSPDGSQIIFTGKKYNKAVAFVVSAQGGELVEFKAEGHEIKIPRIGVNGEWIYFSSKKTGKHQIWKIKSDGIGEAIQITHDGGYYPRLTQDGKMIYYAKSRTLGGIWQVSVNGGIEEKIKEITNAGFQNTIAAKEYDTPDHWTLTDMGIYFLVINPDKSYEIKFYDFATEEVTDAVGSDKIPKNSSSLFATDGTNFLFNVKERVSNIMLAELP